MKNLTTKRLDGAQCRKLHMQFMQRCNQILPYHAYEPWKDAEENAETVETLSRIAHLFQGPAFRVEPTGNASKDAMAIGASGLESIFEILPTGPRIFSRGAIKGHEAFTRQQVQEVVAAMNPQPYEVQHWTDVAPYSPASGRVWYAENGDILAVQGMVHGSPVNWVVAYPQEELTAYFLIRGEWVGFRVPYWGDDKQLYEAFAMPYVPELVFHRALNGMIIEDQYENSWPEIYAGWENDNIYICALGHPFSDSPENGPIWSTMAREA